MLYVDARWSKGHHGIARFSTEVLRRISYDRTFNGRTSPVSPLDVVNVPRLGLSAKAAVFSPGFNVGLSRCIQIPTVHDLIHLDVPHESSPSKRFYYNTILKREVRRSGLVFTVSSSAAIRLQTWLNDESVEVVNVGNGCSAAFDFVSSARERDHLLFVGGARPHKGLDIALGVLQKLSGLRLVVVTSDVEEVRSMVARAGVGGRVLIETRLTDHGLAHLYRTASGLIMPSSHEGFGLPALEALKSGCPVIHWSGCTSINEICGPSSVIVTDRDDLGEWAEAVSSTVRGRAGLTLSEAEQTRIAQYNWDSVAKRIDDHLGRWRSM